MGAEIQLKASDYLSMLRGTCDSLDSVVDYTANDRSSLHLTNIPSFAQSYLGAIAVLLFFCNYSGAAEFFGLGDLAGGRFVSNGHDITSDGSSVVGLSRSQSGIQSQVFRWNSSDGIVGLNYIAPDGIPYDIERGSATRVFILSNGDTMAVGGEQTLVGDTVEETYLTYEALKWTDGIGITPLADLNGGIVYSYAYGASKDGATVVGTSRSQSGDKPVRWNENGGVTALTNNYNGSAFAASNDGSVIVGVAEIEFPPFLGRPPRQEAFRWTASGGFSLLGTLADTSGIPNELRSDESVALAVSADGSTIVGQSDSTSAGNATAFVWTPSTGMIEIDGTIATAVSGDGAVVVGRGQGELFIWESDFGARNLRQVLTLQGADVDGWELLAANSISYSGAHIVGRGINPDGNEEAWIAVLDPFVMLLLGDANGDHTVGLADFQILKDNFGMSDASWKNGDFNNDLLVNLVDFQILKDNFGASTAAPDGAVAC